MPRPPCRRTARPLLRFGLCLAWLCLLLGSGLSSSARAEGGPSIAAAPVVSFGQPEFANMSGGSRGTTECGLFGGFSGCCEAFYHQFWSIPVLAGDRLTIDWESKTGLTLFLLPIGTTDYTLNQVSNVAEQDVPEGKDELRYKAPQTGSLPMDFKSCEATPGPYDFTASVIHSVRLFVPRAASLPLSGTVAVSVRTLDGAPVSDPSLRVKVQLGLRDRWYTVGSAPVGNGVASVSYRLSRRWRHQRVSLRTLVRGGSYQTTASTSVRTRVGR